MIPKGLFTQIALLVLAVAIVITYIRPTFAGIAETQDQIATYQTEREKVQSFNSLLSDRLTLIDGVFEADRDRLFTYMPDRVDPIAVMRDLESIAESSGLIIDDISDTGPVARNRGQDIYSVADPATLAAAGPFAYGFNLGVRGSYSQVKAMLGQLGRNHYPLEANTIEMNAEPGGFIAANIAVFTYSRLPMPNETDLFADVNVIYE
jgi:hypothetical protein